VVRLTVEHLSGGRDPDPVWLWSSRPGADPHHVDQLWWEHHVVRMRHLAVAAVVDQQQRVLMMWRHRFITATWAWELPMGLIEADESPEEASARAVLEETGR
jgi:hypothetical protein